MPLRPTLDPYLPGLSLMPDSPGTAFSDLAAETIGGADTTAAALAGQISGIAVDVQAFAQSASSLGSSLLAGQQLFAAHQSEIAAVDFTPEIADAAATDALLAAGSSDADLLPQSFDWTSSLAELPPMPDQPPAGGLTAFTGLSQAGSFVIHTLEDVGVWLGRLVVAVADVVIKAVLSLIATNPIVAIVVLVVVGIILLVHLLFPGADPNEAKAAAIQQIFDAAHENFYRLFKGYYLTLDETVTALTKSISLGRAMFEQLPQKLPAARSDPSPFNNALAEIITTTTTTIAFTQAQADHPAIPWNQAIGDTLMHHEGEPGWMTGTLAKALEYVNGYMNGLRNTAPLDTSGDNPPTLAPADGTISVTSPLPPRIFPRESGGFL